MSLFSAPSLDSLTHRHGERYKWMMLTTVGLGIVAGVLSTSSFNVAVAALARDFGLGQERVQWAMTGFMAAMTLSMLPASWLLDRVGFRRVFLVAVVLLSLASLGGALAPSFALVVVARVIQGAATGVLQPLGVLVVLRMFPMNVQGRASGILTLGLALTPAVAPAFGGVLVDHYGWQAIFLLNLPFGLIALVLGLLWLPSPQSLKDHPFDWSGAGFLTVMTLALVEGVSSLQHSGLASPWTLGQLVLVVGCALGFARHARRATRPLISPDLFAQRTFTLGTVVSFCYGLALYASTYLIPVFLQNALGYSATAAGSALIPGGIALVATTPIAGKLADDHPPKWVTLAGLFLFGLSFLMFAALGGDITQLWLIIATVVGRIGLGLILPALNLATSRHLDTAHLAQSSVVVSYMRQLGGVLGIAMIAVFVQWREDAYGSTPPGIHTAYAQGFLLVGLITLAAMAAAAGMRQTPRNPSPRG